MPLKLIAPRIRRKVCPNCIIDFPLYYVVDICILYAAVCVSMVDVVLYMYMAD